MRYSDEMQRVREGLERKHADLNLPKEKKDWMWDHAESVTSMWSTSSKETVEGVKKLYEELCWLIAG